MSPRPALPPTIRGALAPLRLALRWAPVWVPAVLLWLVTTRGLLPAKREARRLEDAAPAVDARHDAAVAEHEELQDLLRAWKDDIFRARMRRVWARESEPAGGAGPEGGAGGDPPGGPTDPDGGEPR